MITDNKVWNDPVLDDPKQSDDRLWKMTFIGGLNILMGILLYVVIMQSDVPIEAIPGLFICVGGVFFIVRGYLWYKFDKKKGKVVKE
jgi:uncharacterized membrane protein HdeD (DUF308 family)